MQLILLSIAVAPHDTVTDITDSTAARESRYQRAIIGGSCHECHFCYDKTRLLSRQKYACRDKRNFVTANISRDKHVFVTTKLFFSTSILLSRQKTFCRDKIMLLATNIIFSRQIYFRRDKTSRLPCGPPYETSQVVYFRNPSGGYMKEHQ